MTINVKSYRSSVTLVSPDSEAETLSYLRAKRAGDLVFTAAALVVVFPLMVVIALLIWAEDRGPVLYSQDRVGKDGRHFRFYKFRSMVRNADALREVIEEHNEADGPIFKMKRDPRITRVGRTLRRYSFDELPQLWNVLIGDMSLVGPRPHLPREVAQYRSCQKARLKVQPGLICLREVTGRSHLSFEQWVESDLAYIRQRSLIFDLRILLLALPAIMKADGAY
jgi:lipopolysaccharide/colanic/teichoic acid biosynthesis glycosyltransferase